MTFTFPEGVDAAQVQADLCGLSAAEKAQLESLLNQIDADQFLKEVLHVQSPSQHIYMFIYFILYMF